MTQLPHQVQHYAVPKGTIPKPCTGANCDVLCFWILSPKKQKPLPVDCSHCEHCHIPDAERDGVGVSHFKTCKDVSQFSHRGKTK